MISFFISKSEFSFISLAFPKTGCRLLIYNSGWYFEEVGELINLCFIEMLDRFDIRSLISKTRKIAEEIFGFIFRTADKCSMFFGKIIQCNHPHAGGYITPPDLFFIT